jgi:hypothetical protein
MVLGLGVTVRGLACLACDRVRLMRSPLGVYLKGIHTTFKPTHKDEAWKTPTQI